MNVIRIGGYLEEGDIIELNEKHKVLVPTDPKNVRILELSEDSNQDFRGTYVVIGVRRMVSHVVNKETNQQEQKIKQIQVVCKQIKDQQKVVQFYQFGNEVPAVINPNEVKKLGKATRCWNIPDQFKVS